jgi:hypothetical protein
MLSSSPGQQIAGDLSRGLVQGISGYFSKKMKTPKVTLKAGLQSVSSFKKIIIHFNKKFKYENYKKIYSNSTGLIFRIQYGIRRASDCY